MVSQPNAQQWTVDEYLAYELETGMRYEYIDGQIYMMSGGTRRHTRIKVNAVSSLNDQLTDTSYEVYDSDMRVKISDTKFLYPDFSVACKLIDFTDEIETMLTNPIIVAEVLSDSSADYDRGGKANLYRSLPSLQAYLLFEQDDLHVQVYTRHEVGWLLNEYKTLDAIIKLDAIHCELALSYVYRDIEFDDENNSKIDK